MISTMKRLVLALLCNRCKGSGDIWRDRGKAESPQRLRCPECYDVRHELNAWAREAPQKKATR